MPTDDFISEVLNGILNSLGLSEDNRRRRMRCQRVIQFLQTFGQLLNTGGSVTPLLAGSSYETTTVNSLSSDYDTLNVSNDYRVIENLDQWIPGDNRVTFIIDETDCYKSYVKLYRVANHQQSLLYRNMVSSQIPVAHVVENDGRLLLSSNLFMDHIHSKNSSFSVSSGPAVARQHLGLNVDFVLAFVCDFFPHSAMGWKERQTAETLQRVGASIINEADHCHVVPVGNKSSSNEGLEWRYSFTHIERQLVHSWNNVQYKLYVFMKFILKDLIQPSVPDMLSSYHIKTILFWMIEEIPIDFFVVSNFNQCILRYLTNLAHTVSQTSLPHYFIEGCNLYHNKIDETTSNNLMQIIQDILDTWPLRLFDIQRRNLGSALSNVISGTIPLPSMCNSLNNERRELSEFELPRELDFVFVWTKNISNFLGKRSISDVELLLKVLDKLSKTDKSDIETAHFVILIKSRFICKSAFQLLMKQLLHPDEVSTGSFTQTVSSIQSNIESCSIDTRLKMAAYYVFIGDFQEGSLLLDQIEQQNRQYTYHRCCHTTCDQSYPKSFIQAVHDNTPTLSAFFCHYVSEAVEYELEIAGHLPKALVYEMFRSMAVSRSKPDTFENFEWHEHAILHGPVFMYFIRYIIAQNKDQSKESWVAVDNMKRESTRLGIIPHCESNHNVIGHCYMELGDAQSAFSEFKKSLNIKNDNNAALWHMSLLIWKITRGELDVSFDGSNVRG